ncbi:DNA-binding protein, excisionase family [Corynebacterium epidermidicanis]|uniref:DNA-binding protein, excisionase family n=2 Tax=Corynebacterium epidermidicanis TaxID=1050174 RepID=A0A0G3GT44_9CORY|nr:DNA-binding protein, excisionase family [Corynebacterium epidermidicanis]
MPMQIEERVNLSAQDAKLIANFRRQLGESGPTVTASDGRNAPDLVTQVIGKVLDAVAAGRPISISRMPERITTTTAATMLGVSRPTVMKYIKQGKLSSTMVGTHHRLDSNEVLEFLEQRKDEMRRSVFEVMDLES